MYLLKLCNNNFRSDVSVSFDVPCSTPSYPRHDFAIIFLLAFPDFLSSPSLTSTGQRIVCTIFACSVSTFCTIILCSCV